MSHKRRKQLLSDPKCKQTGSLSYASSAPERPRSQQELSQLQKEHLQQFLYMKQRLEQPPGLDKLLLWTSGCRARGRSILSRLCPASRWQIRTQSQVQRRRRTWRLSCFKPLSP